MRVTAHQRKIGTLVARLLKWYPANARDLPWRRTTDPYGVYVSEIMLQQTQVKTVVPYWTRWMRELPTVAALAAAPEAKVLKLWEGLGYYSRARNLRQAAQVIQERHGGRFPSTLAEVLALPGIGRYTAGALCSIAFGQPVPVLDGNVTRVLCRLFRIAADARGRPVQDRLWGLSTALVETAHRLEVAGSAASSACSHLNQALMELGAVICTPRQPRCEVCPLGAACEARRHDEVAVLPYRPKKTPPTHRTVAAFVVQRGARWLVRQRPPGGINAGLWEFPGLELEGRAD